MTNLARDLRPDLVLIAGDVFDQRRPNVDALKLFHEALNRFIDIGASVLLLAGPSDDFSRLHLDGRWVKKAGVHLVDDVTRVLSPMVFRGRSKKIDVKAWCLPFPQKTDLVTSERHPALVGYSLVEKVVQRLDPTEINLLFGYAWAQGAGRQKEFGALVRDGGQPIEGRFLDFFDLSLLGGRHEPYEIRGSRAHYSGSLMCYEAESEQPERSVTLYEIAEKGTVFVDHYPIRARRRLKVLSGSWEELVGASHELQSDDLLVIRSEDGDLTPSQRSSLRTLSPNVVSVEFPSPLREHQSDPDEDVPEVIEDFLEFAQEMGYDLGQQEVDLLLEIVSKT